MKKFEYKTLFFKFGIGKGFQNYDEELNRLGNEGWECVNSNPFTYTGNTMGTSYLFKREI